jgi:hypothetical protein
VAVNVTLVPRHTDVWLAATDTEGVTLVAVIVIGELVAVSVVVQVALLVIVTVTTSPLASALLIKVSLFVPTLDPFTCHW